MKRKLSTDEGEIQEETNGTTNDEDNRTSNNGEMQQPPTKQLAVTTNHQNGTNKVTDIDNSQSQPIIDVELETSNAVKEETEVKVEPTEVKVEPIVDEDGQVKIEEAAEVVNGDTITNSQQSNKTPIKESMDQSVQQPESNKSRLPTPANTAADASVRRSIPLGTTPSPLYGREKIVDTQGQFPAVGSRLGPIFCLQTIGKGTFSSIHKCLNLAYFHHKPPPLPNRNNNNNKTSTRASSPAQHARIAVAKVEHSSFQQSGVLESEAAVLDFLYQSLPPGTVPAYMGRYKSGTFEAIVMEWLPGNDMHVLREKAVQSLRDQNLPLTRRISLPDAVYLTAEVMLPLLKQMHQVGVVHRDVKPSNCVRTGVDKEFALIDFGLSKSIVVPEDSSIVDKAHPWHGTDWLKLTRAHRKAYYRIERTKADFRGTSMYASLRVHQGRDYAPRDDMWSLLYVFCDLVSGGLPWMQYAANRDREMCQKLKERVHGEGDHTTDSTHELLMGDEYHVKLHRREQQKANGENYNPTTPVPLEMSKDEEKVEALRKAFKHLAGLSFWDMPDYDLLQDCINSFIGNESTYPSAPQIDWSLEQQQSQQQQNNSVSSNGKKFTVSLDNVDLVEKIDTEVFEGAKKEIAETEINKSIYKDSLETLFPVEQRFRWSQLEYNVLNREQVPLCVAVHDWLSVARPLVYDDWDSKVLEGSNRTNTDGLRRPNYLSRLQLCLKWAASFDHFQSYKAFKSDVSKTNGGIDMDQEAESQDKQKLQNDTNVQMKDVSIALFSLKAAILQEKKKMSPPPEQIQMSFSQSM